MGLDIRLPLGLIFALTGAILLVYGLATRGSSMYAISMGININLLWGAVMLAFGLMMIVLSRRQRRP
jgi:hypothetical protein